ncbi:hypothetical protein BGZ63DRAFT_83859 [Mariannaea sp. PMI_226]|nr:hypothetical protein BGZ63DRAFT_83859 [Mariannaea sp. PMI_226]
MSPSPHLAINHPGWLFKESEALDSGQGHAAPENPEVVVEPAREADGPGPDEGPSAPLAQQQEQQQRSTPRLEKKRRRPALSCEQCRRRKIRCDRGLPCVNCVKSKISPCTYAPTHIPASRLKKSAAPQGQDAGPPQPALVPARSSPLFEVPKNSSQDTSSDIIPPNPPTSSVPSSTSETSVVDALAARVRELEQRLAGGFHISRKPDDKFIDCNRQKPEEENAPMKGTISKTRFFGQSHWMNGADMFPNIIAVLKQAENKKIGPHRMLIKCKVLARTIKENRMRPLSSATIGQTIPLRHLADQLVDAYFVTFEGAVRILHTPTFRAEYERYWQNPSAANTVFVMQLQLCMALGATVHDDLFSLRSAAIQWVHEAQLWLLLPPEKSRMTIAGLQIMCMLTIAKATCAVGQDLTWVTTGGLIRQAMYMGLHRDPKHLAEMSVYRSEIRRRLWATILELNLQSAYDAGGPPLISPKHFDTRLPANLNDDQLTDESDTKNPPKSNPDELTDMAVPLALLKSHPLRLTIIKHINEFRSKDSYSETLRLNSELTKACRTLTERLAALTNAQLHASRSIITQFHCSLVQLFVYRCFISLHQPMLRRAAEDPTIYYSRKVSLDSSLKVAQICGLSHPRYPSAPPGSTDPVATFDRLITNGAGLFRVVPMQTLFSIGLEFIKKKEEERDSLGGMPSMGSNDLRSVIEASISWSERRIQSGETNIKGYCFINAFLALADGMERRLTQDQIDQAVIDAGERAGQKSWELLKQVAERDGVIVNEADGSPVSVEEPVESMEGIVEMPFDWLGDFNWDGMNEWSWGRQVPKAFPDLDATPMSQI